MYHLIYYTIGRNVTVTVLIKQLKASMVLSLGQQTVTCYRGSTSYCCLTRRMLQY